ncbi:hypothetical protein Tco_1505724, partial [Tanacetum coccineum]
HPKDFEAKHNKAKAKLALLSSSTSAPSSSSGKNKGLIPESYDWDEEEVSSDENEVTEVKALMALADEERIYIGKESSINGKWTKISIKKVYTLLEMEDDDDRKSFLDYLCIDLNYVEEQRNNLFSKHRNLVQELNTCKEQLLVLKQAKLDLLTMQHNDLILVKSSIDSSNVSSSVSDKSKLSEAEDSALSNHSAETQKNTTGPLIAVTESLATNYDSADDSSVYSTQLLSLKKLDGAELVSEPKIVKSILKSKSTFKAETLKGIKINEPSSAPARGNKSSSASKINSAPAGTPLVTLPDHLANMLTPPSIDIVSYGLKSIGYGKNIHTKCLGGKTGGFDQITNKDAIILYSLANEINIDYANIFWEDIIIKLNKRHREKPASGNDALVVSIAEADLGNSAPSTDPHVLADQTKSISEGLKTILIQTITGKGASSVARQINEETSSTIKLEDLAKLVSHVQPSFKDLDSPEDDPVIVMDDSDEDEDDEVYTTENSQKHKLELKNNKAEAEAYLQKGQPSFPNMEQLKELLVKSLKTKFLNILSAHDFSSSLLTELKDLPSKFNELTKEVKGLKQQVYELDIELPRDLKEIPSKLEEFTKTVASVQAKLKTLDALPGLLLNVTKALNKFSQVLDSASSKAGDKGVPSAGQASTMPTEGEKKTNQATIS